MVTHEGSRVVKPCPVCGYQIDRVDKLITENAMLHKRIRTQQAPMPDHPLARFGYRRPPHWLWLKSQRAFVVVGAIQDIWLIATGRITLHSAWQEGHDHGARSEYTRVVINKGG